MGLYLFCKGVKSLVDFFVFGWLFFWWLVGISMVVIIFFIDIFFYIIGVVVNWGIVGNWEWWIFVVFYVIMIYIFVKMWWCLEVIIDVELIEICYGGNMVVVLWGVKVFIFVIFMNCIVIGYVMLVMVKVVEVL